MVIETVRPFHFRDLGNWTLEQGALWAVIELSLTHSPSFQEKNGIPHWYSHIGIGDQDEA